MRFKKNIFIGLLTTALAFSLSACGGDDDDTDTTDFDSAKVGDKLGTANFKYDTVVIKLADASGTEKEVHLNGLDLYKVNGAVKVEGTTWDIVQRAGVRMSDIFEKAGITPDDDTAVNLIGGDGFDVLRTKYGNDKARLPHADFMQAYAYIYAGDPGSKHSGYPQIGNDSLIVDYDLASDSDVPQYIGTGIASLSMMRMKMMEKVDPADYGRDDLDPYYGLIEIDPKVEDAENK